MHPPTEITPSAATYDWPASTWNLPRPHILEFPGVGQAGANFDFSKPNTKYGFVMGLKIPAYQPYRSPGNFSVEFGYDGATLGARPFGGVIQAPRVQALTAAAVDYGRDKRVKGATHIPTPYVRAGAISSTLVPVSHIF